MADTYPYAPLVQYNGASWKFHRMQAVHTVDRFPLLLCLTPSKGEPVDMTLVLFRYQKAGCSQSFEWHTKTSAIMVASRMCDGSKMIVARLNISVMANPEAMFMAWNAMVDARRAYPQSQLQVNHDTPCIHSQRSYISCSGSTPTYPVHIYHSVRSKYVILCLPKC